MANTTNSTATVQYRAAGLQRLRLTKGGEGIEGTAISSGSTTTSQVFETHRYAAARVSVFVPAAGTDTDSTFTLYAYTGRRQIGGAVVSPARQMQTSTGGLTVTWNGAHNDVYTYPGLDRHFQLSLIAASTGVNPADSTAIFLDVEFV